MESDSQAYDHDEIGTTEETSSKTKGRGFSKKTANWGKKIIDVEFNEISSPCGGEYQKLATQLGYFAKDGRAFPLTVTDWRKIDDTVKNRVWTEIQDNTNVPAGYKTICLQALGTSWKGWKSRVKKTWYDAYNTDEERLAQCPPRVIEEQWVQLVQMWGTENFKEKVKKNKASRAQQDFLHTTGKKPFSVLIKERSDNGESIDRVSIFKASRKKTKDHTTKEMIAKLDEAVESLPEEKRQCPQEREKIFVDNFGKDGHGRMRCMERGITPSMVYGRRLGISNNESMANLKKEMEEKMELQKQDFEKRLQAEREAAKLEIEAFKNEIMSQLRFSNQTFNQQSSFGDNAVSTSGTLADGSQVQNVRKRKKNLSTMTSVQTSGLEKRRNK